MGIEEFKKSMNDFKREKIITSKLKLAISELLTDIEIGISKGQTINEIAEIFRKNIDGIPKFSNVTFANYVRELRKNKNKYKKKKSLKNNITEKNIVQQETSHNKNNNLTTTENLKQISSMDKQHNKNNTTKNETNKANSEKILTKTSTNFTVEKTNFKNERK